MCNDISMPNVPDLSKSHIKTRKIPSIRRTYKTTIGALENMHVRSHNGGGSVLDMKCNDV